MTLTTNPHPHGLQPAAPDQERVQEVPLIQLLLGAYRPRQRFAPDAMDALRASIDARGVTQPIVVRPVADDRFEIVTGERRYLAAQQLGLPSLPALVRFMTDEAALELALLDNLQREDLGELEEAEGLLRLLGLRLGLELGGVKSLLYRMDNEAKGKVTQQVLGSAPAHTVEATFTVLGKLGWPSFVATRLPLFSLPPDVLEALRAGVLSAAGARLIARVHDPEGRERLLSELWQGPVNEAELRRRVLSALGSPGPPVPSTRRLGAWTQALLVRRTWHSAARLERARALLDELAALLAQDEHDGAGEEAGDATFQ